MILDLLKTILTETQFWKMKRLFQHYPELLEGKTALVSTRDAQKLLGIRSDHAMRDLKRLGEITGRLMVEEVVFDPDSPFKKVISDPFGYEAKRIKKGGRKNSRGMRITWTVFNEHAPQNFSPMSETLLE